jgi:HlyD family secretion protein
LEQEVLNAQVGAQSRSGRLQESQATLESTLMDKKTAAAQVNSDYTQDQLQAQTDKALYDLGVIAGIAYSKSKNTADQLTVQHKLSHPAARSEPEGD